MNDQTVSAPQDLAALIGSRLCHDLVNPLGAIGNGVELLEMTGSAKGPELDLIRDAVRDAQARIRFFRIAFGTSGPTQIIPAREARKALEDLFLTHRMDPHWTVESDLPRSHVRLAFLMVLCAETALPMGAKLTMSLEGAGQWRLQADATRVQMDPVLWSVLRFGIASAERPLRPAEVQFAALHAAAADLDLTVNYISDDTGLTMTTA
jgi:histidine phosphotransferase ChpT